ncbi:MAG TPA: PEP-CTERM sorting domain-containing protein, partial [Terriglobales bacterium]|nr:PEP-CTERM sorting domain-containing protein [Terriglobales bacterium]
MEVQYSTNGGASFTVTPEGLVTITRDGLYHIYTFNISGAGNTANALIEVCFTGSTTNNAANHTYLDNLQINAAVPEPATVIGGVLGVVGLCWHQRRRLIRSL